MPLKRSRESTTPPRQHGARPVSVAFRALAGAAIVAAAVAAGGCDEKLSDIAGPTPGLEPTFSAIQREIFSSTSRTGCTNCHTNQGRNPAGGLNLLGDAAYASLVGVASRAKPTATRVAPGDPDNSYLLQKLEGASGIVGLRMPFNGPPYLTEGQILIIRRWIQLGAKND